MYLVVKGLVQVIISTAARRRKGSVVTSGSGGGSDGGIEEGKGKGEEQEGDGEVDDSKVEGEAVDDDEVDCVGGQVRIVCSEGKRRRKNLSMFSPSSHLFDPLPLLCLGFRD